MKSLLFSVLALFLAMVAVILVNLPGPALIEAAFPGSLGPDEMPLTTSARLLLLAIVFVAGMAGAFVVVIVAPVRPGVHALILLAIYLVIDIAAALSLRATQPPLVRTAHRSVRVSPGMAGSCGRPAGAG